MSAIASSAVLPRTGAAVREVLAEHRPDLHDTFVAEFHTAIAETDDDFDTERITRLIGRWWAQAAVLLNPDPETDTIQARLAAGDDSDLVECWQPQPDGSQHVYRRDRGGDWALDAVV